MNKSIKNPFLDLVTITGNIWNERKGMNWARNNNSVKNHLNNIEKELIEIKKLIVKIESEELPMLKELYLKK